MNDSIFDEYYFEIIKEIYWDLGYENCNKNIIEEFLKSNGFTS